MDSLQHKIHSDIQNPCILWWWNFHFFKSEVWEMNKIVLYWVMCHLFEEVLVIDCTMAPKLPCTFSAWSTIRKSVRQKDPREFATSAYLQLVQQYTVVKAISLVMANFDSFKPCNAPSLLWRCWLGSRKGIRPVKNWVVRYWHGYLSGARCKWFACGQVDATAAPSSLAPVKSRMVYLSRAGLPRLSWKKPLNGCSSSSSKPWLHVQLPCPCSPMVKPLGRHVQ